MDGGRRHRAAGAEPARQRDLTRRPDRQGERRGLSQAEVDGDFLREDERSPIHGRWLPANRKGALDILDDTATPRVATNLQPNG
jgi:hypothetical protein